MVRASLIWSFLSIATFLSSCSKPSDVSSTPTTPQNVPLEPSWNPPAGFTRYGYDNKIGWRWLDGSERNCSGSRCIQAEIITKDGCPSLLYGKASILDSSGRNVGYTNATTSGVAPGQRAVLTMPDTTGGASDISAELNEISCL